MMATDGNKSIVILCGSSCVNKKAVPLEKYLFGEQKSIVEKFIFLADKMILHLPLATMATDDKIEVSIVLILWFITHK